MARARAGDEEDGPRDGELQACEPGSAATHARALASAQRRRRQPADIAASGAGDTGDGALAVDVHDEIAANHVQPLHDQAETEVCSAARVAAERAQP